MPRRLNATLRVALLAGGSCVLLAGCNAAGPLPRVASVNPDYRAGLVNIAEEPIPTLDAVINQAPSRDPDAPVTQEDRLRGGAMRDAALSYGARAGLAWESRAINRMLQAKAPEVTRTYDFGRALIKGPGNSVILPPVISQANEAWETSEAGKTLRVADTVYEIVEPTKFAAVAPQWQSYLIRTYKSPELPPDVLLPRDGSERDQWRRWVTEGWQEGQRQAQETFKLDLERLHRDFTGMIRYKALLEQGKVSAPVVADAKLGNTGTGTDMRVNDRAIRITQDPKLNVGKSPDWRAPVTTPGPDGVPTGTGDTAKAPPTAPAAVVAPPRARPRPVAAVRARAPEPTGRRAWDEPPPPAPRQEF